MGIPIAIIQFNPFIGNPEKNLIAIKTKLLNAKINGAKLVLLGELALSGYYAQDLFFNETYINKVYKTHLEINKLCKELNLKAVYGLPLRTQQTKSKNLYNSLCLVNFSKEPLYQHKKLIPTYKEFDEYRWFQPGQQSESIIYELGNKKFGFLICEDGWNNEVGIQDPKYLLYENDPIHSFFQSKNIPDFLINISASPDYLGKQNKRISMYQKIAKHYNTSIIFVNLVGAQDELIFSGRSFVINNKGDVYHECNAFKEDLFVFDSDLTEQKKDYKPLSEMEELDGLLKLYLEDYFKKSGLEENCEKIFVGLSGGKDSTLVASVLKKALPSKKIIGISMPYKLKEYTMPESVRLAKELANNLKIEFRLFEIDKLVDPYITTFDLTKTSLAHQNAQARVRANILWNLANKENGLVINTTNFSEAAVGYGTIGGDLLGLPLIASIPATVVIKYLFWLKENGHEYLTNEMILRPPSAELCPGQLDAIELGDYNYIDPLLEALRMNYCDQTKVLALFENKKHPDHHKYFGDTASKLKFLDTLSFLNKRMAKTSEFKRWYYNKTPQITPYGWLRWKWPIANAYFDSDNSFD